MSIYNGKPRKCVITPSLNTEKIEKLLTKLAYKAQQPFLALPLTQKRKNTIQIKK